VCRNKLLSLIGVLLSTLGLIDEILEAKPEFKDRFKKHSVLLVKVLRNLVSSYSGDYEISGIIDPFLQVLDLLYFLVVLNIYCRSKF
jgi:hypothetical protein